VQFPNLLPDSTAPTFGPDATTKGYVVRANTGHFLNGIGGGETNVNRAVVFATQGEAAAFLAFHVKPEHRHLYEVCHLFCEPVVVCFNRPVPTKPE
jgi:hypothetical protein